MNTLKVALLLGVMTTLLVATGHILFDIKGAISCFIFALSINFYSYFFSDRVVIKMTRAYPITFQEAPELHRMVGRLAIKARIPIPKLYVQPSDQPNAFATGRNPSHAAVAVTEGLMRTLNKSEVEGVLAHELAHIKNRDVLLGTIAASMAVAITMLSYPIRNGLRHSLRSREQRIHPAQLLIMLAVAFLAPLAAMMIQAMISRTREYAADAAGASIAGSSEGLVNALLKLESAARYTPMLVNQSAAHMFIMDPFASYKLTRLYNTHPSVSDRVKRLKKMQP